MDNIKVQVNYNPYFYEETQISISAVENITFKHRKLNEERIIGEFVKDKNYRSFYRKWICRDILKCFEKDFKAQIKLQKETLLNNTEVVKRKKIKKFAYTSIYSFLFICLLGTMIKTKLFNVPKIDLFLERKLYNNLLICLIYLSLFASLFLYVTKAYYEVTRLIGNNSKRFIYQEFRTINNNFRQSQRLLKSHLYKQINYNNFKQQFKLKQIYDPQIIITNLEKYRFYISDKMVVYSKNYYKLLVIKFILKLIIGGLIFFLGIAYIKV